MKPLSKASSWQNKQYQRIDNHKGGVDKIQQSYQPIY